MRIADSLASCPACPLPSSDALERVLLRVSEMVCEFPQLREMDINPLIVDEDGAVAVDARVVLHPIGQAAQRRLRPPGHPALPGIASSRSGRSGWRPGQRAPVRPDDAEGLQDLVRASSPRVATSAS